MNTYIPALLATTLMLASCSLKVKPVVYKNYTYKTVDVAHQQELMDKIVIEKLTIRDEVGGPLGYRRVYEFVYKNKSDQKICFDIKFEAEAMERGFLQTRHEWDPVRRGFCLEPSETKTHTIILNMRVHPNNMVYFSEKLKICKFFCL